MIATLTTRQAKIATDMSSAALQAKNYRKLARMAETLEGMGYEADRLYRAADEAEADVGCYVDDLIGAGVTPEQMDEL